MLYLLSFISYLLSNNNSLCLHVFAVDQAQHINSGAKTVSADALVGVAGEESVAQQINDLNYACAVDDELSIADESEIVTTFAANLSVVSHEHQFEA